MRCADNFTLNERSKLHLKKVTKMARPHCHVLRRSGNLRFTFAKQKLHCKCNFTMRCADNFTLNECSKLHLCLPCVREGGTRSVTEGLFSLHQRCNISNLAKPNISSAKHISRLLWQTYRPCALKKYFAQAKPVYRFCGVLCGTPHPHRRSPLKGICLSPASHSASLVVAKSASHCFPFGKAKGRFLAPPPKNAETFSGTPLSLPRLSQASRRSKSRRLPSSRRSLPKCAV